MMNFADSIHSAVISKKSVLVLGIDPRADQIPAVLLKRFAESVKCARRDGEPCDKADARVIYYALRSFCFDVIDACAEFVCAVKIQVAFFEELGPAGFRHLADVIKHARNRGLLVIADAKRGDISSTSDAYARAWFAKKTLAGVDNILRADALTIAPYLGRDTFTSFEPYCKDGAGAFILCRTSNKSAIDLQDLKSNGHNIWEKTARLIDNWGAPHIGECGLSSVGAVLGATYHEEGMIARKIAKHAWFLVPGIGTQGGQAEDARCFTRRDGLGAIFNVSRGILYAYKDKQYDSFGEEGYAEAARIAAEKYRDELWEACGISR